jgi:hypothetical protein
MDYSYFEEEDIGRICKGGPTKRGQKKTTRQFSNQPRDANCTSVQNADILPQCAISKRLRYEKQIKALHLSRLLSLEMLHGRVEIEKQY